MKPILFVLLLSVFSPSLVYAEPNECVAGLLPNVTISTSSQQLNMATLKVIDERTFQELQRGGSGSAKFPVKGVPIEASGSYQEWDRKRREYLEVNKFDLSYDEAFLLVRREIPEIAYAAYKECLVRGSSTPGIHIIIDDYSDKEAFVTIMWTPPPNESGSLGPTTVNVEASGTTPEMSKLVPITLGAGHTRPLTFPLVAGSPFVVTASTASGFSQRKTLEISPEKLKIPDVQLVRQATMKELLIKALDEGRVCVARVVDRDGSVNPVPYVGGPAPRATRINNLFEVKYDSSAETWLSHGRDYNSHPRLELNRGPSLAKQQINIHNVLFSLGEDGVLTAVSNGLGYPPMVTGYLFCPITTGDLR